MRLAFIGFRHGHIMGLYKSACTDPRVKVVAASEDHEQTAGELKAAGSVTLTHSDYRQLLKEVDCDAVAVGDYFARRGEIIIAALKAGKHVIADKPICTTLDELAIIAVELRLRRAHHQLVPPPRAEFVQRV